MVEEMSHQRQGRNKDKNPFLLTALATLAFVLLLVMMMYLGTRLNQAAVSYGIDIVEGQTVYVPVYSHIYADGGEAYLLETTVSIRNSDPERSITVLSAQYYDTKGTLIEDFVEDQLQLGPLETTAILVEKRDARGGSGANFIVEWSSNKPVYEPIIEAVMVGNTENQSISFKSIGRPLVQRLE